MKNLFTLFGFIIWISLHGQNVSYPNNAGNNDSGDKNTAIGWESGFNLDSLSNQNTFLGFSSGYYNTSGESNTFLGHMAGYNNTTGKSNLFVGSGSGESNTTGDYNVYLGTNSGISNQVGEANVIVGFNAGFHSSSSNSVFMGYLTGVTSEGNDNTFIGHVSGNLNTTGINNTFIGSESGQKNTIGNDNVFIGKRAGLHTDKNQNVIIGASAGENNTASGSTFIGFEAGYTNESDFNTFVGNRAGRLNASGNSNTFIGSSSGENNSTGAKNTFVGNSAGLNNVQGVGNTFMGDAAGHNSKESWNTMIGANAGLDKSKGHSNTFLGAQAGEHNEDGSSNTFIGEGAGENNRNGINNTYLGRRAGAYATSHNGIFIGSGAGHYERDDNKLHISTSSRKSLIYGDFLEDHVAIAAITTPAQQAAYTLFVNGDVYTTGTYLPSDKRYKKNIQTIESPLQLVNQIEGKSYEYKQDVKMGGSDEKASTKMPGGQQVGFIAQDLRKIMPDAVREDGEGMLSVNYTALIPVLVEAVKELTKEVERLENQLSASNDNFDQLTSDKLDLGLNSEDFGLEQNYPNPSSSTTSIRYSLPNDFTGNARLVVFDLQGKKVKEVSNLMRSNQIELTKSELGTGIFTYALIANGEVIATKKMLIE